MVKEFKVFPYQRSRKPHHWIVRCYPDLASMRAAYAELSQHAGMLPEEEDAAAVVIPQKTVNYTDGKEEVLPTLGYALFAATHLGQDIISHEAVHLATNYFRHMDVFPTLNKEECDAAEEELAFCVGDCARQLQRELVGVL
jgi:hypothetical protein